MQGMHIPNHRLRLQDPVVEDVTEVGGAREGEVVRVARAEELQGELHDFFAGELAAGEVVEDLFAVARRRGLCVRRCGRCRCFRARATSLVRVW